MHGAKNVNVTNCTFRHLGLTGVLADFGSQGIRVTHSHFADLSGSAVALGNVSKAIMTPEEQDGQFTVENNRIRDTGAEYQVCSSGDRSSFSCFACLEASVLMRSISAALCVRDVMSFLRPSHARC